MKNKIRLLLDIVLTAAFLLLMDPKSLGTMAVHEWLGLGICVFFILHKVLNWNWIKTASIGLFGKSPWAVKRNYFLDVFLLLGMSIIVLSGMKIAKTIDFSWLPFTTDPIFWRVSHLSGSMITLAAIGVHIGLHWKWITVSMSKIFGKGGSIRKIVLFIIGTSLCIAGFVAVIKTDFIEKASRFLTQSSMQTVQKGYGLKKMDGTGPHAGFGKQEQGFKRTASFLNLWNTGLFLLCLIFFIGITYWLMRAIQLIKKINSSA
jgi:hypothetical protein